MDKNLNGGNLQKSGERIVRYIALIAFLTIAILVALDVSVSKLHVLPQKFLWVMFDLGSEANLPTWFACVLWLFAGMAALLCFWADQRVRPRRAGTKIWLLVSAVFIYASLDEVATIHEEVGTFLREEVSKHSLAAVVPEGSPHSPWILFYLPVVVLFLTLIVVFLWRRLKGSPALRLGLLLAVESYLVAIGLDYFQGLFPQYQRMVSQKIGMKGADFVEVTVVTEETLELVGTATLLVVLSTYALRKWAEAEAGVCAVAEG